MILIATGVNEVIAGSVLPYVPLYVYLGAVALVVLFDGVLPGALAAIVAIECYAFFYAPPNPRLSMTVVMTLGAAAATVIVAALLRGLVRASLRRERPPLFTPPPPMLATSMVAEPAVPNAEVLTAIEELRAELRAAITSAPPRRDDDDDAETLATALADARAAEAAERQRATAALRARDEERRRVEALAADRATLRLELDQAREAFERERTDASAVRADRAGLRLDHDQLREENALLAARIANLDLAARDAESARAELSALRHSLDLDRARAEGEKTLREHADTEAAALRARLEQLQSEFDAKLEKIVAHLASDHELDIGQAIAEKEEARAEARVMLTRLNALQRKLDERDSPRPARILVAHPDEDLRRSAQASLERVGYAVVTAADGLEALKLAASEQPDVVIADAVMPKMNGRELCQLLKSHDRTAHIRVLLLLRSVDEPPKGELMPDDVLHKPVPFEKLRSSLAALLGARAPSG